MLVRLIVALTCPAVMHVLWQLIASLTDSNLHTYQITQPYGQLLSVDASNSHTSLPESHSSSSLCKLLHGIIVTICCITLQLSCQLCGMHSSCDTVFTCKITHKRVHLSNNNAKLFSIPAIPSKASTLMHKCHPYTGNPNSEMSGDSRITSPHGGDVSGR